MATEVKEVCIPFGVFTQLKDTTFFTVFIGAPSARLFLASTVKVNNEHENGGTRYLLTHPLSCHLGRGKSPGITEEPTEYTKFMNVVLQLLLCIYNDGNSSQDKAVADFSVVRCT